MRAAANVTTGHERPWTTSLAERAEGVKRMLESRPRDTAETAAYYDDTAVSRFYESCWGGSDIHIGLYATGEESVAEASSAMTRHLLERTEVRTGQRVLDISCGFGGTLRMLARMGCRASGIDIAPGCVRRAEEANADAGLGDVTDVSVGDFHSIDSDVAVSSSVMPKDRCMGNSRSVSSILASGAPERLYATPASTMTFANNSRITAASMVLRIFILQQPTVQAKTLVDE